MYISYHLSKQKIMQIVNGKSLQELHIQHCWNNLKPLNIYQIYWWTPIWTRPQHWLATKISRKNRVDSELSMVITPNLDQKGITWLRFRLPGLLQSPILTQHLVNCTGFLADEWNMGEHCGCRMLRGADLPRYYLHLEAFRCWKKPKVNVDNIFTLVNNLDAFGMIGILNRKLPWKLSVVV